MMPIRQCGPFVTEFSLGRGFAIQRRIEGRASKARLFFSIIFSVRITEGRHAQRWAASSRSTNRPKTTTRL